MKSIRQRRWNILNFTREFPVLFRRIENKFNTLTIQSKNSSVIDKDWLLYPFSNTQWTEMDVDIRVEFVLSNYRKVAKFRRFLPWEPFAIFRRTAINFLPKSWVINYLALTLRFHEMFSDAYNTKGHRRKLYCSWILVDLVSRTCRVCDCFLKSNCKYLPVSEIDGSQTKLYRYIYIHKGYNHLNFLLVYEFQGVSNIRKFVLHMLLKVWTIKKKTGSGCNTQKRASSYWRHFHWMNKIIYVYY